MADNRLKATDIIGADGAEALFEVYGYTSAAAIAGLVGNISRGTASSKTIVSSGDAFRITATGYDGVAQRNLAEISMAVGGTPGSGDMPGSIVFKVTPDGSTTLATALTIAQNKAITAAGAVTVTGAATLSSTLAVTGAATFSNAGTHTFGAAAASGTRVKIQGAAGGNRGLELHSGTGTATTRWAWLVGSTAESGSNTGSPMVFNALSDDGVYIDSPINIIRASGGLFTISRPLSCSSTLAVTGDSTLTGDLAVNGGDFTSSATTFNLLNATVTTANVLGAATSIVMGAATGTCQVRNSNLQVDGNLLAYGSLSVFGNSATDRTNFIGSMEVRSVTDAGPMTATAGTVREIVFNTSDSKFYGCSVTGSPATWVAFN